MCYTGLKGVQMKVMIIGDVHAPYEHPNYFKFLKDQRDLEKPDKIIFIGDLVDLYALSRFTKDPKAPGQYPEFDRAMKTLRKLYRYFPEAVWLRGNHDERAGNTAKSVGLSDIYLRDLTEVYDCPPQWEMATEIDVDGVSYSHGMGAGSSGNWQMHCLKLGKSSCTGHTHSVAGYRFHARANGETLFSMKVGSGVDEESLAFAYGKWNTAKSVLSCGFVEDGYQPSVKLMNMNDRRYRRVR